jgi:hypothetical protein
LSLPHLRLNPIVAIGPQLPGIGSWEWVGLDAVEALERDYDVRLWRERPPACDLLLIVKYSFASQIVRTSEDAPVIFVPIDCFGSSNEMGAVAPFDRFTRLLHI